MAEVWNVPGVDRPPFLTRLLRGFCLLGVLGVGLVATTLIASLSAFGGGLPVKAAGVALSVALNIGLFVLAFRVLTVADVPTRSLLPGAILGGICWSLLQVLGAYLVGHQLRHASQVYGYFASVLGLVSWLFLGAQLTLYAAEANVVWARRLWPRSIVQPPLTDADKRAFDDIALQGERRPSSRWSRAGRTIPTRPDRTDQAYGYHAVRSDGLPSVRSGHGPRSRRARGMADGGEEGCGQGREDDDDGRQAREDRGRARGCARGEPGKGAVAAASRGEHRRRGCPRRGGLADLGPGGRRPDHGDRHGRGRHGQQPPGRATGAGAPAGPSPAREDHALRPRAHPPARRSMPSRATTTCRAADPTRS